MVPDSARRRDDRPSDSDGDAAQDGQAAPNDAGETLAEKILRYRQPAPPGSGGGGAAPGSGVVRAPREE